ncbi:MAG: MmgE/PrpD family protein [Burkholderiales bacterium]|nr:MmgE/PrpD family protein [Burkholderiales bacterium]
MTGLTAQLAEFAAHPERLVLDDAALAIVRTGFIDTIGGMLAGAGEPVTGIVRRHVLARGGAARHARLLMGSERAASRDAALVNATAGHALDYDDVALAGHPSVVLVPALLAEGERLGASGAALMRAYVVGYEVWADLLGRESDRLHLKGWHPTAVFGTVAGAAAVAALAGLDAARCRHALGIAASMAGGLIANFGSMVKPLHAGRAAACAIEAAELAAAGLEAAPDALEHHAGYLAALSPAGRVDRETPAAPGTPLRLAALGLSVKKYPMCYATHRVIDAVLDLAHAHDIDAGRVRAVHATVGRAQASMLRNHAPATGLEAKFSLEFAIAAALAARKVGLAELADEVVRRDAVRALFPKVAITTVDTESPSEPTFAASDRVVIETVDGARFDSGEVREARGSAALPLRADELRAKFLDCAAAAGRADGAALFGRLAGLERIADVNDLLPA